MLYDELIADTKLAHSYTGFGDIQKSIAAAHKFILERDFALAADGLVENYDELERIAPFCRVPYSQLWIEFAQADRKHWLDAPMHYPEFQSAPKKLGFLIEAKDAALTKWQTHLCWSLKSIPPAHAERAMQMATMSDVKLADTMNNCSLITVDYDISEKRAGLHEYVSFDVKPFFLDLLQQSCRSNKELLDISKTIAPIFQSDWAGEIRYLFAILGLLNARNVAESVKPDFTKVNKARKRNGKPPMYEHTLLKIRALHRPSLCPTNNAQHSGEIRAHFVRGHFKTRQTGIFWWGPHVRGNRARGFVEKDYAVAV